MTETQSTFFRYNVFSASSYSRYSRFKPISDHLPVEVRKIRVLQGLVDGDTMFWMEHELWDEQNRGIGDKIS